MILWLCRQWLQCKLGRGSEEHKELIKDLCVFLVNTMWAAGQDPMQKMLLWMRYMYGTMAVTRYEKHVLFELGLEAGAEPDYSAIEAEFEQFDLHTSAWQAGRTGELSLIVICVCMLHLCILLRSH